MNVLAPADAEIPAGAEEPWRRLGIRVVYLDLIRVAISLVTGYLGFVVGDDPVWPLIAGSCAALLGALLDLKRWRTTRYRITSLRVEMRSGWLTHKHRIVALDGIRSVNSSARVLPRLLGLRTVHIGSGEPGSSFSLDALDRRTPRDSSRNSCRGGCRARRRNLRRTIPRPSSPACAASGYR